MNLDELLEQYKTSPNPLVTSEELTGLLMAATAGIPAGPWEMCQCGYVDCTAVMGERGGIICHLHNPMVYPQPDNPQAVSRYIAAAHPELITRLVVAAAMQAGTILRLREAGNADLVALLQEWVTYHEEFDAYPTNDDHVLYKTRAMLDKLAGE